MDNDRQIDDFDFGNDPHQPSPVFHENVRRHNFGSGRMKTSHSNSLSEGMVRAGNFRVVLDTARDIWVS